MTNQPTNFESVYDPQVSFHMRQARIGVAVVRELSYHNPDNKAVVTTEDRDLARKETVEYLTVCTNEELAIFADNLELLYATTAAVGQGFNLRDVDLFSQAFFISLESETRSIGPEKAKDLGNIVLRGRYSCQAPSMRPKDSYPYNYDNQRHLLFESK